MLTRQWLLDESDLARKRCSSRKPKATARTCAITLTLSSALSRNYYANDSDQTPSDLPRYTLNSAKSEDTWFFNSLARAEDYNINVNYDDYLQVTRVWINVSIRDHDAGKIGIAGAGIDLTGFLAEFMSTAEAGVTPIIVNKPAPSRRTATGR